MHKRYFTFFTMAFFIFFVFSPVNIAAAYTATDAADELANIYKYIDANDKPSISNARLAAQGLTDADLNLLTDPLVNVLPESVLAQYPGDDPADQKAAVQVELRECFRDLALIVYNENTVESDLSAYKEAHKVTFQKLFGTSFTVDDLYELLLAMREEMPKVIYQSATYSLVVESGSDAELIAQIPNIAKDAANNVVNKSEFNAFADKLVEIGWDTEMLMDAYIALCDDIDDANSSAELALVKAAVRSQIYLYLCDADENIIEELAADELAQREVSAQQPAYFQAYIGNQNLTSPNSNANVTSWFLWDSSNEQIGINDMYPEGKGTTLELTSEAAGITGTITGYRDAGQNGDPVADWLLRFDVTMEAGDILYGDVNDDGVINVDDAAAIIRYFVRGTPLIVPDAAYVTNDGSINVDDAAAIIRYYVRGTPLPVNISE